MKNIFLEHMKRLLGFIFLFAISSLAAVAEGVDYTIITKGDDCVYGIKTANGLQNITGLPTAGCKYITYELENDIVLNSSRQVAGCTSNWDASGVNLFTKISGTFDGKGHSISGVCINEYGAESVYLFNATVESHIKNVKFENIYMGDDQSVYDKPFEISIFRSNGSYAAAVFLDSITLNNVTIEGRNTNEESHVSFLFANAYNKLEMRYVNVQNSFINVEGNAIVGSLIGESFSNVFIENSQVASSISVGRAKYVGGMIGYVPETGISSIYSFLIKKSSFTGTISAHNAVSLGGIVGHDLNYYSLILEDVQASSPDGYKGSLIDVTADVDNLGGLVGYAYAVGITDCIVLGRINKTAYMSTSHTGGLVGYYTERFGATTSFFIGYLPNYTTDNNRPNGFVTSINPYNEYISKCYAVDLNSNARTDGISSYGVVYAEDITEPAFVYLGSNSLKNVKLQSPEFANRMGLLYDPLQNNGLPVSGEFFTHKISFNTIMGNPILQAYTDVNGQIAYKLDGSPLTKDDIPKSLTNTVDLKKVYYADSFYGVEEPYDENDYEVDDCVTFIKSTNALLNIESAPRFSECTSVTFKLTNDLDFDGDFDKDCSSNWPSQGLMLPHSSQLDGDGHKIRGVCVNNEGPEAFLFSGENQLVYVKNLIVEDVFIKAIASVDDGYASLFSKGLPQNRSAFVENVSVDNITIDLTCIDKLSCYAGTISAYANDLHLNDVKINNATINVNGAGFVYVGGLLGDVSYNQEDSFSDISFNGKINVSSIRSNETSYVGGAVGRVIRSKIASSNVDVSAEININVQNGQVLVGGLIGEAFVYDVSNSSFTGIISGTAIQGDFGGIFGKLSSEEMNMTNVSVTGDKRSGKLFDLNVRAGYVGGGIGSDNSSSISFSHVEVIGDFIFDNAGADLYAAGLLADVSGGVSKINQSTVNGSFSGIPQAASFSFAPSHLMQISNSYAVYSGVDTDDCFDKKCQHTALIEKSGNEASVYSLDFVSNFPDTLIVVSSAFPKSPKLAYMLNTGLNQDGTPEKRPQFATSAKTAAPIMYAPEPVIYDGFFYDSDMNDGYPSLIKTAGILPTHRVSWIDGSAVSAEVYTDKYGVLTYMADGYNLYDDQGKPNSKFIEVVPAKRSLQKRSSEKESDSIITWVNTISGSLWDESRLFFQDAVYLRKANRAPSRMEYAVSVGDVSNYKPLLMVQEVPTYYVVGEPLILPEVGTVGLCHVGWNISNNGNFNENILKKVDGGYPWISDGRFLDDVTVTPLFEKGNCETRNITLALAEDYNGASPSDLLDLVIMFGNDTLPVNKGKITLPYIKGLALDYHISVKDRKPFDITSVSMNKVPSQTSGSLVLKDDIVFNVSLEESDAYNFAKVHFEARGSAAHLAISIDQNKVKSPGDLHALLYADGILVKDSLISSKVEAKAYSVYFYPLKSRKKYFTKILLKDSGNDIAQKSNEVLIDSVARNVPANTWHMISLAGVGQSYQFPDYNEAAFFSWNEESPIGDYMQYHRLSSMKNMKASVGYWTYTSKPLALEPISSETVEDSIRWNLNNRYTGWNLISNPFSWEIYVGNFSFENPEDSTQVPWKWNSKKQQYEVANTLDIYEAMWVYTRKNRKMALSSRPYFTKPILAVLPKERSMTASSKSWSLRLILAGENGKTDSWNVVGQGSRDISLMKPPATMGEALSLNILDGSDVLAKSIKTDDDLFWNVELNSSIPQKAKLSVVGLDELEQNGLNAYLEMDGRVEPLSSTEPLEVSLGSSSKRAVLRVSSTPVISKAKGLGNLRYSVHNGKLAVNFFLGESFTGHVTVSLYDAQGHVLAQARDDSYPGNHEVTFTRKLHSGIGILKVSAGGKTLTSKVKF